LLELSNYRRYLLLITHVVFGVLFLVSGVSKIVSSIIILYAIVDIINSKNENNRSLMWVSYFMSAEVFFRMSGGMISWELVKYITFLLLFIGVVVDKDKLNMHLGFLIYILLLFIGVSFTDVPPEESTRKQIIFNLLGPVLLGWCAIVFYKKKISLDTMYLALFYAILPIISMVIYLYFRTPTFSEIRFSGSASFAASGGFGPNQVATALGLGFFLIGALIIAKKKITGFVILDILIFLYIVFRCLLTFSRGGMFTGILALIIFAVFFALSQKDFAKIISKYVLLSLLFLVAIWVYTSEVTGGMLDNRYKGKNARGVQKEDISSGRIALMSHQFENFLEHPFLGIGVGNGKSDRLKSGNHITGAAHNEIGRMLEEHGLVGFLSLILLISIPLTGMRNKSNMSKAFTLSFYFLWFLTINHSAMRIALPSLVYGMSLINITTDEEN